MIKKGELLSNINDCRKDYVQTNNYVTDADTMHLLSI